MLLRIRVRLFEFISMQKLRTCTQIANEIGPGSLPTEHIIGDGA